MSSDTEDPQAVGIALSELKRSVDVGLAQINGQLGIILQRLDASDRRDDEHTRRLEDHDVRLRQVERDAVTEAQLSARSKQVIAVVSLIVAIAGVALGIFTGVKS